MIITKTPLRIGLVGGSTDIPEYYRKYGGLLVSAAINKYIYIIVNKKFDHKIRVSYSKTEIVDTVEEIRHPSVREAMKLLDIDGGIEILSVSDIPSTGTGLGSSSTFLVGLLNALHAYKSEFASRERLAEEAIEIERNILREPGGMQDQYMASFGGINMLKFNENDSVYVNPVTLDHDKLEKLKDNMALLYTGIDHNSGEIHHNIRKEITSHLDEYEKMKGYSQDFYHYLYDMDIKKLGTILDHNWHSKKLLYEKISTPAIDEYYARALKLGAYGGNLIGAGGGGFLVFIVDSWNRKKLDELGLRNIDFDFDFEGSRIIYFSE
ncbi:MAG: kinase [Ferroplasma sp.]|uniref:GHMP family kinase ATP-binding protein n=1 Tax=Ferroplasma sp. TaxID=2591003 RepID=UPI00281515BD|nr:kinase [Ferroplasma sp.]WMT52251.1 MAG: kinase [Ferroplasma sp.]